MLFFLGATNTIFSQTDQNISLTSISVVEEKIELTFQSDQQFFIGDNRYVLHIGAQHFLMCKHPGGDESKLTYILSEEEFSSVQDGAQITLVYGYYFSNTQIDGEGPVTEFIGMHWKIGSMNKTLLNR